MKSTVRTAYNSPYFFRQIQRMLEHGSLVANTEMPEQFKNGWKVIIPYTNKVLDLLLNQEVFMDKSVRMDTLGGPFLKNHLLYEVDGNAEWISVAKKYGIDHVSNKRGLGKVLLNAKQFRTSVTKLP